VCAWLLQTKSVIDSGATGISPSRKLKAHFRLPSKPDPRFPIRTRASNEPTFPAASMTIARNKRFLRRGPRAGSMRRGLAGVVVISATIACSASEEPARARAWGEAAEQAPTFLGPMSDVGSAAEPPASGIDALGGLAYEPLPPSDPVSVEPASVEPASVEAACVVSGEQAELVKQPVDIILLLDNSGSMSDELEGVEANINANFASILASSDIDYRVILISRHRQEPRAESDEASTSICVSVPLSGLASCSAAPEPMLSERFFQYSTKLESDDSFDILLDTFAPPFDSDDRQEKFGNAPLGWSAWLRPAAKKVLLEVTDADEDMPLADFLRDLTAMAPEQFGAGAQRLNFVFHSIVGLAEKADPTLAYLPDEPLQPLTCTGSGNQVTNSGPTYQELSRLTGGLRFSLCQFGAFDVVFRRIAEEVVFTSSIACDFPIPPAPAGSELDLAKLAVQYNPGDGSASLQLGQAPASGACQSDAFYIFGDRVHLCPDTCSLIRSDPAAGVDVLFTCESQLLIPR
jgi:hypothetical protein